jgi:hypothetical protein
MTVILRRNTRYMACEIKEGDTTIDMGLLDGEEAEELTNELLEAGNDLRTFAGEYREKYSPQTP